MTDLDLNTYDLPTYSSDQEERNGIPAAARRFLETIRAHDAIVISMAEHNGSYTAAFKNLYDWTSRIESKLLVGQAYVALLHITEARGGASVMATAAATFPRMGADLRGTFSLPSFYDNFTDADGITDPNLAAESSKAVQQLHS